MTLKEVSPQKVLAEVAAAIPAEIHPSVVIIGSLAAGYWLFQRGDETRARLPPRAVVFRDFRE